MNDDDRKLTSRGFTKLDSGIIYSTLWWQADEYLRVWIALLALSDANGYVRCSVPALAKLCLQSVEQVTQILTVFEGPDPHSRITTHEGRKIKAVEGGWLILNYKFYRGLTQRKPASHAERQKRYRDRHRH